MTEFRRFVYADAAVVVDYERIVFAERTVLRLRRAGVAADVVDVEEADYLLGADLLALGPAVVVERADLGRARALVRAFEEVDLGVSDAASVAPFWQADTARRALAAGVLAALVALPFGLLALSFALGA
ncbi:MAG: hypothetical protein FJW83_10950 [Actinobacteria bacterium]|nr:hypothetical protein [Actinomycetota bacterium]